VPTADYLVMTAGQGDLEAVKLFAQAGYPVDTKDNDTPAIVSAARGGHVNVIAYLMSKGANVNATDGNNMTALMHLVDKCEATPTIVALIKAGARKDGTTAGGVSTAQLAEWSQCTDNLKAIK
jgi:ankyrin repeat protein